MVGLFGQTIPYRTPSDNQLLSLPCARTKQGGEENREQECRTVHEESVATLSVTNEPVNALKNGVMSWIFMLAVIHQSLRVIPIALVF